MVRPELPADSRHHRGAHQAGPERQRYDDRAPGGRGAVQALGARQQRHDHQDVRGGWQQIDDVPDGHRVPDVEDPLLDDAGHRHQPGRREQVRPPAQQAEPDRRNRHRHRDEQQVLPALDPLRCEHAGSDAIGKRVAQERQHLGFLRRRRGHDEEEATARGGQRERQPPQPRRGGANRREPGRNHAHAGDHPASSATAQGRGVIGAPGCGKRAGLPPAGTRSATTRCRTPGTDGASTRAVPASGRPRPAAHPRRCRLRGWTRAGAASISWRAWASRHGAPRRRTAAPGPARRGIRRSARSARRAATRPLSAPPRRQPAWPGSGRPGSRPGTAPRAPTGRRPAARGLARS